MSCPLDDSSGHGLIESHYRKLAWVNARPSARTHSGIFRIVRQSVTGTSQGRCHCHIRRRIDPYRQTINCYHSDCHDAGYRPRSERVRRQPCTAGREHYRTLQTRSRTKRKTIGAFVPRLSRVAILGSSTQPANAKILKELELAAEALGIRLQYLDVRPQDFESAFQDASTGRADAVLMLVSGPVYNPHRTQVVELAVKSRVPAIYCNREDVEVGGLLSYGVHLPDLDRRAATYVDKILKVANPADLPVEEPTKFELVINLKTAKQIGLTARCDLRGGPSFRLPHKRLLR